MAMRSGNTFTHPRRGAGCMRLPLSHSPTLPFARVARHLLPALCLLAFVGPARAQTPDPRDYSIIQRVPREEVDSWLKDEIKRSGGDLDTQRYHWILGFSTGHYGSDPVHAIAMRRLAFSVLNNTLAPGDQVTPEGWEMKVWNTGDTIKLTPEAAARARFVDEVPYAPSEGSKGGHDTERALYDTLQRVSPGDAKSTIILLLTNTNQSQGPTGSRAELFGADNRQLAEAIRSRGYRNPVRHTFSAQAKNRPISIDVTALFPQKVASLPGAAGQRRYPTFAVETWQPPADRPAAGEPLPNPAVSAGASPAPAPAPGPGENRPGSSPLPLILGLLALLAVAAIVWWLLTRKKGEPKPEEVKPVVKGRPLPGAIKATIGSAPNSTIVTLDKLTSASRWTLVQDGARPALSEEEEPTGTKLARLALDEKRRLTLDAEGDTVFQSVTGVKADAGNPRRLVLAPGDHLVCRVAAASTVRDPVRLELMYQEKG